MSTKKNNNRSMLENLEGRTLYSVAFNEGLDLNHDGQLNAADAAIVASGDLDQDGQVGIGDATTADAFGGLEALKVQLTSGIAVQTRVQNDPYADYDFDHDGFHTAGDFSTADAGDFDGDGEVTIGDVTSLDALGGKDAVYQMLGEAMKYDQMLQSRGFADVDFNKDGLITEIDQAVAKTGDFNLDGVITSDDTCIEDACGGPKGVESRLEKGIITNEYLDVDLDHDGQITIVDVTTADAGDFDGDGQLGIGDITTLDAWGGREGLMARLNEALNAVK